MDWQPRPPPPPPPPRPLLQPLPSVLLGDRRPPAAPSPSISLSPSLFIIAAIIVVVVVTSLSIHLLLRFLSCRRRSSSAVAALPLPLVSTRSASRGSSSAAGADAFPSDGENAALIESLPVFTLASALAALPKSSPECAVCLCPFRPDDRLRLLPACCHAFHSSCVDPWLRNTPSCPLCRASITLPAAPLQLPPTSAAALPGSGDREASRSGSFRIEIGSVSRRRASSGEEPGNPPPPGAALPLHLRTYSIGSSFEYLVEEEVEAVVARIARRTEKLEKREEGQAEPGQPGEGVAEAVGGGGGRGGWLKEYVDRLASSASSSFSSLRFSGRWSHRWCEGDGGSGAVAPGHNAWELEGSARREAEEGGYYGFYRWLIGA